MCVRKSPRLDRLYPPGACHGLHPDDPISRRWMWDKFIWSYSVAGGEGPWLFHNKPPRTAPTPPSASWRRRRRLGTLHARHKKTPLAAEGVSTDSLKRCIVHRHRHDGQTHCAQASKTGMACLQRLRHCSAVAMAAARAAKRLWHGLACLDTLANLACRDTLADLACRDTLVSREARISLVRCRSGAQTLRDSCVLPRNDQTITTSAWGEARRLAAHESLL